MGRERWSTRLLVERCRAVDVESMQRDGVFGSPWGTSWKFLWLDASGNADAYLDYAVFRSEGLWLQLGRELRDHGRAIQLAGELRIRVTSTRPHFGRRRFWFLCPFVRDGKACGRRVGRLYLPPGEQFIGCRICPNLIHESAPKHDARVYQMARDPATWKATLRHKKLGRKLLATSAFSLWLRWQRKGRARQSTRL